MSLLSICYIYSSSFITCYSNHNHNSIIGVLAMMNLNNGFHAWNSEIK